MNAANPFFETLYRLRHEEQLVLFAKELDEKPEIQPEIRDFLADEYEREALDYPFTTPPFDPLAAVWAAKAVYFAAQLLVHFTDTEKLLEKLFPPFPGKITASAMLSADLCLRFLPQLALQFKAINPDDKLVILLEKYLSGFHYSAIGFDMELENNFGVLSENDCLRRLYLDRIWERKDKTMALRPEIMPYLKADYGMYAETYWPGFALAIKD